MKIKTIHIPEVGEEFKTFTHPSGMRVILAEKDLYTGYGLLCVDFGSILEEYEEEGGIFSFPDGTAHFLEHKMFENPDGADTFVKFDACGADANAYTSTDRTCYLFSTSDDFCKGLSVLLESVFTPFFTPENVKKEKGIILQELKMYRDNPYEAVSRALISAMYERLRIRNDICGSIRSVKSVTADDLTRAYTRFYRPERMILTLCGRFNADEVIRVIDACVPAQGTVLPPCRAIGEKNENTVFKRKKTLYCGVTTPMFAAGIKCPAYGLSGQERLIAYNYMSVAAQALFATSSPFVSRLRAEGLLPFDCSDDVVCDRDCAHILFFAHTFDVKKTEKIFFEEIGRLITEGIGKECFERTKKLLYSSFLSEFNSSESTAHLYSSDAFDGIDTSLVPSSILNMTCEKAAEFIAKILRREAISVVAALPQQQKGAL